MIATSNDCQVNAYCLGDLISDSTEIKNYGQFLIWHQEALQKFLPHELMISAWGDFSMDLIFYRIVAPTIGNSTDIMAEREMTLFLKRLYSHWILNAGKPFQLVSDQSIIRCREIQNKSLKTSLKNLKSAQFHGIRDVRTGSDSFYVLLNSSTSIEPHSKKLLHQILPYIDSTLRQVESFPGPSEEELFCADKVKSSVAKLDSAADLSDRESQIMGFVCAGKTNIEIGLILDISSFTVKNHLQRIFKKLNVVSRSQAITQMRGQLKSL